MNRRLQFTALALVLVMALCLLPVSALAASNGGTGAEEDPVLAGSLTEEEEEEEAETQAAEEPEEAPGTEPAEDVPVFYCSAGELIYTTEGSVCYNDGGLVYNNAGTVYNNGGLVYNNAGLVYNNEGTVYSNGGVVYNNAGLVYSNGAQIHSNNGQVQDSALYGYDRVSLDGDYDELAEIEGLRADPQGGWLLRQGENCVIRPRAGLVIAEALAQGGQLTEDGEGGYILTGLGETISLSLRFKAQAPVIDLAAGTYAEAQTVQIQAPEGVDVYYSTDGSEPTAHSEKYTGPLTVEEGLVLTAVAVVPGAENSDPAQAAYAIVRVTGPEFEPVTAGYIRPQAQSIKVENLGTREVKIKKVSLSGPDAFRFHLSQGGGKTLAGGETEETLWTVQPVEGLKPGEYSAVIVVSLDHGENIQLELSFTVNAAETSSAEADAAEVNTAEEE